MTPSYTIRPANLTDTDLICAHRRAMFFDMGHRDAAALDAMTEHFLPWVILRMREVQYLGWFAIAADQSVAAGIGIWLMNWPPHMIAPGLPRANILNVYTEPAHRRQGLARELMDTAVAWCRGNGIRTLILHSSQEGRALYQSLGFEPTNEMRLTL